MSRKKNIKWKNTSCEGCPYCDRGGNDWFECWCRVFKCTIEYGLAPGGRPDDCPKPELSWEE